MTTLFLVANKFVSLKGNNKHFIFSHNNKQIHTFSKGLKLTDMLLRLEFLLSNKLINLNK